MGRFAYRVSEAPDKEAPLVKEAYARGLIVEEDSRLKSARHRHAPCLMSHL